MNGAQPKVNLASSIPLTLHHYTACPTTRHLDTASSHHLHDTLILLHHTTYTAPCYCFITPLLHHTTYTAP